MRTILNEYIQPIDEILLIWIQQTFQCRLLNYFFSWYTQLGDSDRLWLIISILLLFFKSTRKTGVISLLSIYCYNFVADNFVRTFFQRHRPYFTLENVVLLVPRRGAFCFPSGHACAAFSTGGACIFALKKSNLKILKHIIVSAAFLMAFSRVYVGMHYPFDVICGGLMGIISSRILYNLWQCIDYACKKST